MLHALQPKILTFLLIRTFQLQNSSLTATKHAARRIAIQMQIRRDVLTTQLESVVSAYMKAAVYQKLIGKQANSQVCQAFLNMALYALHGTQSRVRHGMPDTVTLQRICQVKAILLTIAPDKVGVMMLGAMWTRTCATLG
jgi:hypothetical protein